MSDVRIVAATHRSLEEMVAAGTFRSDLYYRLNVFPIVLPALRERREDIPRLVRYFVQKFARGMNKMIDTIPSEAMSALAAYDWPGNVRELENAIERAVILTSGSVLQVPLAEFRSATALRRLRRARSKRPSAKRFSRRSVRAIGSSEAPREPRAAWESSGRRSTREWRSSASCGRSPESHPVSPLGALHQFELGAARLGELLDGVSGS